MKLKELTVGHYQLIAVAASAGEDKSLAAWLSIMPEITGRTRESYASASIDVLLKDIESVKAALDEAHEPTPPHEWKFEHEGLKGKMMLTKSVELMTAQQFIDASELSKSDISANLHLYLATFYTCAGLTTRERAEIIKQHMTLDVALSALAFFLECAITLQTALSLCLEAKAVMPEHKKVTRKRNGLGIWLLSQFSKAQVTIGRRLLKLARRSF